MKIIYVFFLLSDFSVMVVMQELTCKRLCGFVNFPMDSTIDLSSCTTTNVNGSFCSMFAELDYEKNFASGRLGTEQCTDTSTPYMQTEVATRFKLISTVRYTCAQNNCDSDFLRTMFPLEPNLSYQNWTTEDITDLLGNSASPVFKANCIAVTKNNSEKFCLGNLTITGDESKPDISYNYSRASCSELSKNDNLLSIRQSCSSAGQFTTTVTFRYDADNCEIADAKKLAEKISLYFPKSFNCSAQYSESNCTRTESGGPISTKWSPAIILLFVAFLQIHR